MPRILVADDNTNIQKMVVLAFQERGVEVIAVGNGEAAVRRLPDANPDLVLADVFMPVRNGYEVCEFVKKDPRFAHVPVILLVGAFDPLDEKEARRVGADGVLKKPFVPPDPLIAMVMSALEKNPKVAAELARAKEIAAEAALPPALPEVPLKSEPKPLPDFPEPTAEEAAVIYGFGKGVRAIDLDEVDEEEEEEAKPKPKAKSSKESKAPAAPKTPVVQAEDDEDDFDSAATANDWRRNAADFEVPENVAADPVYSYGRNFEPITFPSEKDVPPRRRKTDETGAQETAASAETKSAAAVQASAEPQPKSNPWDVKDQPEIELAHGFTRVEEPDMQANFTPAELTQSEPEKSAPAQRVEVPRVEVQRAEAPPAPAQRVEAPPAPPQPAASQPAAQQTSPAQEAPVRPTLVSRMRGWMDMLTPASPENSPSEAAEPAADTSENHWMTNLSAPPAAPVSSPVVAAPVVAAPVVAAPVVTTPEPPAPAPAVVDQAAETQPIDATPFAPSASVAAEQPSPAAAADDFAPTATPEVRDEVRDEVREEAQPRQFGDSSQSDDKFGGSSYHFSDDVHNEVLDESRDPALAAAEKGAGDYDDSATVPEGLTAQAQSESEHEPAPEPISSGAADFTPAFLPPPSDAPVNGGGLSGMLPAEPLFGGDRQHAAMDYSPQEDHLHQVEPREDEPPQVEAPENDSREQEAFAADTHPAHISHSAPDNEPWNREAAAREEAVLAQSGASLFAESEPQPPALHSFERIPTLPPPNREALADIPFLIPPVLPPQNSEQPATPARDAEAVDDMVRKVMEKLGPHLQELLSQGVKPLVENLLQTELQKKDR